MKKIIKFVIDIPNRIYNFFVLKYRHVKYGNHLKIYGRILCVSNSADGIVIGNDVSINSSHASNPIGGDSKTTLFAKGNGKIRIGDHCGISNSTIFAVDSITIGNNVFLGGGTKIYDSDFHWLDLERRMKEDGAASKQVVIEDGVFVGAHTIILKGVTIGKEAVVGAGSVVTKSIPAGEIWGGNPAKFIRCVSKE